MQIAVKVDLDANSFAKAKIDKSGLLSLAYSANLSPNAALTLGVATNVSQNEKAQHQLGVSLVLSD